MSTEFRLPQLTESTATVKLSAWLKREGEAVTKGEPIVEVETDKTSVELEAPESGVLTSIQVQAGSEKVSPGTVIALIGPANGDTATAEKAAAPSAKPAAAAQTAGGRKPATTPEAAAPATEPKPIPAAEPKAAPAPEEAAAPATPGPAAGEPALAAAAPGSSQPASGDKIPATALAMRMAVVAGLDLASIPAQGRRVTKADVEAVLRQQRGEPAGAGARMARQSGGNGQAAPASFPVPAIGKFEDRPVTAMRRVTAARLQQAKQTIPHFYLQADCRADALLDLRKQINATGGIKITVTDLIVAAAAMALRRVPAANSAWLDGAVRLYESIDIAVAVNTPQGLITPVVRGCESKSLAAISRDLKDLSERARAGKLKPDEYTNGTFTISNLGMFGVTSITPIVNPPQCCILGIGATEARAVVEEGKLIPGHVMSCTIAADHRAIDGVQGAELLQQVRSLIEQPMAIALGL